MGLHKKKRVKVPCLGSNIIIEGFYETTLPPPKVIRCPVCYRKLLIRWFDCEHSFGFNECWHGSIPPHKTRKNVKIEKAAERIEGFRKNFRRKS